MPKPPKHFQSRRLVLPGRPQHGDSEMLRRRVDTDVGEVHIQRYQDSPLITTNTKQLRVPRPGRYASGSAPARPVIATRLGWFWKFWSGDSSVLEVDALRGLQLFHEHAEFDVAPASPSGSEPRLRLIQAAREAFEPMATTFRSRREHPKLSAGEAHVLDQLEEYRRTCLETRRALVSELIEWVKEGRGQLLLPRRGRAWKKEKLSAEVVLNELRLLAASHAGPLETLGDAHVVASSFGRDFG